MLIKEYKLPFMRWVSSEDQIYSMMTIVYNTVLCVRKLPCVCVCVCPVMSDSSRPHEQ